MQGPKACRELIGAGDVSRPWSWGDEGFHVHAEAGWVA